MSNSSRTNGLALLERLPTPRSPPSVSRPIVGLAFWAAIALPFLHMPLLVTGLDTTRMTAAFIVLVAVNVIALVIGHGYRSG